MYAKKLSYFADFVACPVAFVALLLTTLWSGRPHAAAIWGAAFICGLMAWSFVEYAIHRWIYHHAPFIRTLHDRHHLDPRSYEGSPAFLSVFFVFLFVYAPLAYIGPAVASGATAGMLIGYLAYMVVHHIDHHYPAVGTGYLYRARKAHARHHYARQEGNYGVTTLFWDRCFGTLIREQKTGGEWFARVQRGPAA
jgi:sterol desaturase/sphingolipid hydroxylase (fatty acid hydroxylase superfamily)